LVLAPTGPFFSTIYPFLLLATSIFPFLHSEEDDQKPDSPSSVGVFPPSLSVPSFHSLEGEDLKGKQLMALLETVPKMLGTAYSSTKSTQLQPVSQRCLLITERQIAREYELKGIKRSNLKKGIGNQGVCSVTSILNRE